MKFKVANYELKINSHSKIDNIWLSITNSINEYYIDIDHVENIPFSQGDKHIILKLKKLIQSYKKNKLNMFDVISHIKLI